LIHEITTTNNEIINTENPNKSDSTLVPTNPNGGKKSGVKCVKGTHAI